MSDTNTTTPTASPEAVQPSATTPAVETPTSVVETPVAAVEGSTTPAVTVLGEAIDQTPKQETTNTNDPAQITDANKQSDSQDQTNTEGGQSDEPASPPKYDPFKFPEGAQVNQERVTEFTNLLADLETKGKADHALVQEFGQRAVDFHVKEMARVTSELTKLYQTAWDKQKTDWKDSFMKDPEMGGNRWQTTVDSALSFIRTHGGTAEQQADFRNLMETSGLGNHPAMIRLLANAGRAMKEGAPLAASKPVPQEVKSKVKTLYGKS